MFIRVGFALLITILVNQFHFDYIESLFYDGRVRLRPAPSPTGHVEIIAVDPASVEKFGKVPGAKENLELIQLLHRAGAKFIVYLMNPVELAGSPEEQRALAATMQATPELMLGTQEVVLKGAAESLKLPAPFDKVAIYSSPRTADKNNFAADDVTRRLMISYQGQRMLQHLVASEFNPSITDENNIRGVFDYLQSNQSYVDFAPTGTYQELGFYPVMKGEISPNRFKDKIVLVGRNTQSTAKDYILTPYSREIVAMSLLEHHANAFDTLIRNSGPIRTPRWLDFFFTAVIAVLTVNIVLKARPTKGLLLLLATIAGYAVFAFLLFWPFGIWISMAHPFLAIFVCYYFFIPYRLIIENRRSWEYQQKNRLLMQVEELKTNFLSMMSHDLKTPIARIQGMTELILSERDKLSERQQEAVGNVAKSSQELLEFVSSILNLGRIESKELKLHLSSRDLNRIIEEVTGQLDYLAKSKNIEIICELEPLFSIKIDVDLIRQVIFNLIENAIKYSRENSRILVTSEESDGKIVIQIADQGPGLPEDELPHVFMKFYRSKNAKASSIKGSGLGLYLAKYFVELHHGTITVDSRFGEGSTFTVELPVGKNSESQVRATQPDENGEMT